MEALQTLIESPGIDATMLVEGPAGRKAISSNPISLPIPPGALFFIRITTEVMPTGVVKYIPYCFHTGVELSGISPEL